MPQLRLRPNLTPASSNEHVHEAQPGDDSKVLIVNLLKSKKSIIKAWRFVQEGEVVNTTLDEVNA